MIGYKLFLLLEKFLMLLPNSWRKSFFTSLGALGYLLSSRYRNVVFQNLDYAFDRKMSQEEKEAIWICEHSSYAILAPKLSLKELVAFISSMDLVIGNDTGPTHMAWAQNIPSLTLFGPTTSRMIYETLTNLALQSSSAVDIFKINKNDFSIKDIEVQDIVQKAKELL